MLISYFLFMLLLGILDPGDTHLKLKIYTMKVIVISEEMQSIAVKQHQIGAGFQTLVTSPVEPENARTKS